jgi:hypothetical protein
MRQQHLRLEPFSSMITGGAVSQALELPSVALWANAVLFTVFGTAFLIDPQRFYLYTVSRQSEAVAHVLEYAVAYGAANLAIGMWAAYCAARRRAYRIGLIGVSLALVVTMGIRLFRLQDNSTPHFFTYWTIAVELLSLLACLAALRSPPPAAAPLRDDRHRTTRRSNQAGAWVYPLTAMLAAVYGISSLQEHGTSWPAFLVMFCSIGQFLRPTVAGWFVVLVGYGVELVTLLADIGLQLDDYGSGDHGYFEGWGMVYIVMGFAAIAAGLLLRVAVQLPGGNE